MHCINTKIWSGLIATLFLLTLLLISSTTTKAAIQNSDFVQSQVQAVAVDPGNSNLWVVWGDQQSATQHKLNFSSFNSQGIAQRSFSISNNFIGLGFAFVNNTARYYYANFDQSKPGIYQAIGYVNLATGTTSIVTSNVGLTGCSLMNLPQPLVYNPLTQHLYLPCEQNLPNLPYQSKVSTSGLVVDTTTDKVTALLTFNPLAFNTQTNRLYAAYTHAVDNGGSPNTTVDLIAVDGKNEQLNNAIILQNFGVNPILDSVQISTHTNHLWVVATPNCEAKCTPPTQYEFDANGVQSVASSAAPVERYDFFNESTSQLYGPRLYYPIANKDFIAVDANNINKGQIASFYWKLLAVDQVHNRVYAINTLTNDNNNGIDEGLGILMMSGTNFDITQYIMALVEGRCSLLQYRRVLATLSVHL